MTMNGVYWTVATVNKDSTYRLLWLSARSAGVICKVRVFVEPPPPDPVTPPPSS